jgi:hypothetical protein
VPLGWLHAGKIGISKYNIRGITKLSAESMTINNAEQELCVFFERLSSSCAYRGPKFDKASDSVLKQQKLRNASNVDLIANYLVYAVEFFNLEEKDKITQLNLIYNVISNEMKKQAIDVNNLIILKHLLMLQEMLNQNYYGKYFGKKLKTKKNHGLSSHLLNGMTV